MRTTLLIFLCSVPISNSESIAPFPPSQSCNCTCPSPPFNEEYELAKIASHCFDHHEHEEVAGNILPYYGLIIGSLDGLIKHSMDIIGLRELRSALGFEPLGPWKSYNSTEPSEEELKDAPTVEAYYNLKEPRSVDRSLDSKFYFENNTVPAVIFFDKKLPSVKEVYRQNFLKIRQEKPVDRQMVDSCLKEFARVQHRVEKAKWQMKFLSYECDPIIKY